MLGQIDITPTGGDSSYTYLWNGPNGFTSSSEDLNNLHVLFLVITN